MIYLELFLTFLKIGAVCFGGGYGMIALIRDDCLQKGWLTEGELLNFIAVAESTPGPIAVNMATFVGSAQGGFLGALVATLGIVLPSFLIILLVASLFTRLLKYGGVKATLGGIRPAIVAMILATGLTMLLGLAFGIQSVKSTLTLDLKALLLFAIVATLPYLFSKWKKKALSPILLILLSGVLGILFYEIL